MCEIFVLTTFLNYAESITNSPLSYLNYDVFLLNSSVLFFWKVLVKVLLVCLLAFSGYVETVRWPRKVCLTERSLRQEFAGLELTVPQCPQDLWISCLSLPSDSHVSSCLLLSFICKQFILLTYIYVCACMRMCIHPCI